MTSPGVTWTFLGIPHAIALVGDDCTMWGPRLHNVVKGRRTHSGIDHDTSRSTPEGIAGTQVARKLILQGGPTIQTVVSLKGYVSVLGELRDERRVTPNHRCMPLQLGKH
jgi:hypothetical protein